MRELIKKLFGKTSSRYTIAAIWWLICGIFPYSALLIEFGREGNFLAQIYPHFFIYPLAIGFFVILCLAPPLAFIFRNKLLSGITLAAMLSSIAVGSIYTTWADVTQGDPAIWDFKAALEILLPNGQLLIKEAHFLLEECPPVKLGSEEIIFAEHLHRCNIKRKELVLHLNKIYSDEERSFTHFSYIVSLFLQTFTIGVSVVALGSLVVYKARFNLNLSTVDRLLAFVFFFYTLWIPFRFFALQEKANLYYEITYLTELPITIVVLICYVYSICLTWKDSGDFTIHIMQAVVGSILLTISIMYPEILLLLIGRESNPANYPIITIVLVLALMPWIIIAEDRIKEGYSNMKSVFLSYSHKDAATANKLKRVLISNDINVQIDTDLMSVGSDINDFVRQSILNTDYTVSIVSKHSLLSAWVAMETISTLDSEKISKMKWPR